MPILIGLSAFLSQALEKTFEDCANAKNISLIRYPADNTFYYNSAVHPYLTIDVNSDIGMFVESFEKYLEEFILRQPENVSTILYRALKVEPVYESPRQVKLTMQYAIV